MALVARHFVGRLFGALLAFSSSAFATSFSDRPFPETVRSAPTIVRGKVGKSDVQWVALPDGSRQLFTFHDIEVSEGIKGQPKGGTIRMRELGGAKDGVALNISGAAQFQTGEDVVLLLGDAVDGAENTYPLSGMMMGKLEVEKNAEGKEVLRGPAINGGTHPSLRAVAADVTLEDLRQIVKTQAEEALHPKPSPSATVTVSDDGLLGSKARHTGPPGLEAIDSPPEKPPGNSGPLRAIYFIVGGGIGIAWFLKTRRKRR